MKELEKVEVDFSVQLSVFSIVSTHAIQYHSLHPRNRRTEIWSGSVFTRYRLRINTQSPNSMHRFHSRNEIWSGSMLTRYRLRGNTQSPNNMDRFHSRNQAKIWSGSVLTRNHSTACIASTHATTHTESWGSISTRYWLRVNTQSPNTWIDSTHATVEKSGTVAS